MSRGRARKPVRRIPLTAAEAAPPSLAREEATPGGAERLPCLAGPAGPGAYVNANRAGGFRAETDVDSHRGDRLKQGYRQQGYQQQGNPQPGRGRTGADDIAPAANVRPPAMDHFHLLALASEIATARLRRG
jgi:hypothetical protein